MTDVLITANSPGEVAWVKALALELERRRQRCHVILYPCTFATGQEERVLRSYPAVDRVWTPGQLAQLLWSGGRAYPPGTPLIHLGGDLMYSVLLRWRWGWRAWSYLWARPHWNSSLTGYFSRDARNTRGLVRAGATPAKVVEVGDLIVDAVDVQVPELPARDANLVTFMPGSRPEEIRRLLPFYAGVAEALRAERPELRFQATLSPFLSWEELGRQLSRPLDGRLPGPPGGLRGTSYVTDSGVELRLHREDGLGQLARSALAVSIPGTKTAEAARLGVPCLTVVPLNCPELLPYGGLLGLLDWIPGGSAWKGRWLLGQRDKVGLLAQPNQLLKQAYMPELIDELSPAQVARVAGDLLRAPEALAEKGRFLREAYAVFAGCSGRILDGAGV